MFRISLSLILTLFIGCSRGPVWEAGQRGSEVEVEDGGGVENTDRKKTQAFFDALCNAKTAEDERVLLSDFSKWLKEKRYKICVDVKKGEHHLSCPYFPPVTPWISHSFLDIRNLDLLPRLGGRGSINH